MGENQNQINHQWCPKFIYIYIYIGKWEKNAEGKVIAVGSWLFRIGLFNYFPQKVSFPHGSNLTLFSDATRPHVNIQNFIQMPYTLKWFHTKQTSERSNKRSFPYVIHIKILGHNTTHIKLFHTIQSTIYYYFERYYDRYLINFLLS